MMEEETPSYDSQIFNSLQSNTNNTSLLSKFQQKHNDDHIVEKKLIKIIKLSAFRDGIENIAGKAMSILKKLTKTIKWENFQNIRLKDCSMRGVSFIDCNFSGSIMENVKIDSCWFIGCRLDNVKWLNITCSEQKLIKVAHFMIEGLDCSEDGTQLFCTSKIYNSKYKFSFNFYEFYSGKMIQQLSTTQIIDKVALLTEEILADIHHNKLRFFSRQNQKFKFSKYLRNVDNFFEFSNGILIIQIQQGKYILQSFFKPKMLRKIKFESCKSVCSNRRYFAYQDKNCIEICDLTKVKSYKFNLDTKIEKELFFTPNNQEIAVRRWNNISFWNIRSLQMTKKVKLSCSKLDQLFKKPLSNDGQMLMTHNDGIINLHNLKAVEQFKSFHTNENSSCKFGLFHPTKKIMITGFRNHIYYLDCFAKQKIIIGNNQSFSFIQLTMSYNKEFFALLNTKNQIQIFRVNNGEIVQSLVEENTVTSIAFSPINNILIFGKANSSIRFYDFKQNKKQKYIPKNIMYGKICRITFSPNGSQMAFAGSNTPDIVICDGKTGDKLQVLKDGKTYSFVDHQQIQFSSNGQFLAQGIEDIRLWNLEQRNQCQHIAIGEGVENFVFTFTPNNEQFVYYYNYTKIKFLDILLNIEVKTIDIRRLDFMCFLNKGQFLLCCSQSKFLIFDTKINKSIQFFNNDLNGQNMVYFDFSMNGIIFMGSDKGFSFWDVYYETKSQQILAKDLDQPINLLAFSKTNQLLISEANDGTVKIYQCQQEYQLTKIGSIPDFTQISLVRLSKSGILLALVDSVQGIQIWNLQTLQQQNKLEFHKNKIQTIDISDNDQQLLSLEENIIHLWDIAQNKIVRIINPNLQGINDIFFSSDGQEIYCFCSKQSIYLISLIQQEHQQILYKHSNIITCLKISPDRKYFIFGSQNGKIYILDLISKAIAKEFYEHEDQILNICFSPDEKVFASLSKDRTICFWKIQFDTLFEKVNCILDVNTIIFMNNDCLAYGCSDGVIKTIQFLQQNIRPLNYFTNIPKYFQGRSNTVNNAEILSTQGFSLVELIKNSL